MKTPGLVTAVVLSLAGSDPAQESRPASQPWRAEVRVVDDHGGPVAYVLVRARLPFAIPYSDLARRNFETRTDAKGLAAFEDLLAEEPVVFEVSHGSYVPTRSAVTLPHPRREPTPIESESGPAPISIVLTTGRSVSVRVMASGASTPDGGNPALDDVEVRILPLLEGR